MGKGAKRHAYRFSEMAGTLGFAHPRRSRDVDVLLRRYTRIGISTYSAAELSLSWISVGEPGSARRSTATSPSICEAMSIR
jgi:hypothetical protein